MHTFFFWLFSKDFFNLSFSPLRTFAHLLICIHLRDIYIIHTLYNICTFIQIVTQAPLQALVLSVKSMRIYTWRFCILYSHALHYLQRSTVLCVRIVQWVQSSVMYTNTGFFKLHYKHWTTTNPQCKLSRRSDGRSGCRDMSRVSFIYTVYPSYSSFLSYETFWYSDTT